MKDIAPPGLRTDLVNHITGKVGTRIGFFDWNGDAFTAVFLAHQLMPQRRKAKIAYRKKLVSFEYSGGTVRALAAELRTAGFVPPRGLGRLCTKQGQP